MSAISNFIEEYISNIYIPRTLRVSNIFEIIILAIILYEFMAWVKTTRAFALLKGIIVILVFLIIAYIFDFTTILWIAGKVINIAIIAVVVIFQPELRKALEQLGQKKYFKSILPFTEKKDKGERFSDKTVNELVRACFELAKNKTGALIVIEQDILLTDYEKTGIPVDGIVTSQLLINIFEHNTPLHDGAVVIRGNRVAAATCYLPLSDNMSINKALGTRHRAAVGVSETTDSLTIVVSEETGRVSVAEGGMLRSVPTAEALRNILSGLMKEEPVSSNRFKIWKGRLINGKKADK